MDILTDRKNGQSTLEYLLLFVGVVLVIYFVAMGENNTYSIRKGYQDILRGKLSAADTMAYRHQGSLGCKKPDQSCTNDLECCNFYCQSGKCT